MSDVPESTPLGKDAHGNPFWTCDSPAGKLEITINLAKPEKDPRAIAAAAQAAAGKSETCDLCWAPPGDDGPAPHLLHSGEPVQEVRLGNEDWAWWFSPYGYFPEHLIVAAPEHRPMVIDHDTIARLLDFADAFPQWFIGSNADLPIVGGSILGHDHFQGGGYRFPLMDAPVEHCFAIDGLERVEAGIVRWPASVVRLRCTDRAAISEAACRVMDAWRPFTFEECAIEAFTLEDSTGNGMPASGRFVRHNTLNPILWREGDDYVMDLVLRNNRTTPEHPFGLFHVPESLFRIKKENIGLIEIMGRAILPGRLAAELPAIKDECSRAFYEILQSTGVFKQTPSGLRGWEAFMATV